MAFRNQQTAAALGLTFLLSLILAAPPNGPAAAAPLPEDVLRDIVDIAGANEPHTPPALNRAIAYRYYAPQAARPSLVLLLIPGLNSGPNSLDLIARALVSAYGSSLEVWAVAMRTTQLQDRRGVEEALAYGNPAFALAYYYGKLAIGGQTFHLLQGPEVPYMAYWGVDVHLRDIRALVREIRGRYPGVPLVMGGHSLGGIMAAAYAGYDFAPLSGPGSAPAQAASDEVGGRELSGLLFIDGMPLWIPLRLSPDSYLNGITLPILGHIPGVNNLTAPDPRQRVWPFTRTSKIARTRDSILLDVLSVYAFLRPDDASIFPFPPRQGVPITNEALLAAVFSDQMEPDLLVRAAVETPIGIFDRIPDPANINRHGLLDLATGRPLPGEPLIRLPAPQERRARVPMRSLVNAILRPSGDFTLWYFPWRLILDFGLATNLDTSDSFARQYLHLTHVRDITVPILAIGAGHGIIRSAGMTDFYLQHIATPPGNEMVKIFSDYSHLDIEDAEPNPAVPLIVDWLKRMVH